MRRAGRLCTALSLLAVLTGCVWNVGCSADSEECSTDEDCPTRYECAGLIFPTCTLGCSFLKCEQGMVCVREAFGGGKCERGCKDNDDCPAHSFCAIPCRGLFCPDPCLFCSDVAPQCETGCHDDGECDTRKVCLQGKCIPHCYDDTECDAREVCRNGTCVQPCSDNGECGSGSICAPGLVTL